LSDFAYILMMPSYGIRSHIYNDIILQDSIFLIKNEMNLTLKINIALHYMHKLSFKIIYIIYTGKNK
jgi:hypothetical protein